MEGMVAAATKPDTKPAASVESSKFVGDSEPVRNWELTEPACRQMKEHNYVRALVGHQQYTAMLVMVISIPPDWCTCAGVSVTVFYMYTHNCV